MRNPFANTLDTFSYEEQINEINKKINELANEKHIQT